MRREVVGGCHEGMVKVRTDRVEINSFLRLIARPTILRHQSYEPLVLLAGGRRCPGKGQVTVRSSR